MAIKLGNPGSRLHAVKLVVLHVLYRAEREIDLQTVLERGWPETFPHRDPWGMLLGNTPDYEEKMAFRIAWMNLERDAGVALRDLRKKGLAKSWRYDGYGRNQWQITTKGQAWLEDDLVAFADSVGADLAGLPTTEKANSE